MSNKIDKNKKEVYFYFKRKNLYVSIAHYICLLLRNSADLVCLDQYTI